MATPAQIASALQRKASRIRGVSREAALAAAQNPPPPPPLAPPPKAYSAGRPVTQEDRHFREIQKRSLAMAPPAEGHTRLFRQGNVPSDLPPMSMADMVDTPRGRMPRAAWEKIKAEVGHTQPFGAAGRWFTDRAPELDFYVYENPHEPTYYVDVPNDRLPELSVKNTPFSKVSRNHDREFVLPDDALAGAKRLLDGLAK